MALSEPRAQRPEHYAGMTFLLLCVWGLCVFFAVLGYGVLLLRICRVERAPWAIAGTVGVPLLVALGGLLNLAQWIRPAVLISSVLAGDGAFLFLKWREIRIPRLPGQKTSLLLTLVIVVLIAVPVVGNIRADVRSFSLYDDLPAYLTLPIETLQLGSLPFDPFNERRVTSSLGASYFLQSYMTMFGGVESVRFFDVSVGLILYAGALLAIFRMLGLSQGMRLGLLLLMFLAPVDRWNTTSEILPAALFCALFFLAADPAFDDRRGWKRAVLLAFTAACLCSLKSNYLPAAILIGALYYAFRAVLEKKSELLLQGLMWGALTGLFLLPWMIDMHRKEATYLFPIFGRGYDASSYGTIPLPNGSRRQVSSAALWVWVTVLPMAGPLLVAFAATLMAYRKKLETKWVAPLAALLLGAALAIVSIASSTGGESMGRYSLPFQLPALFVFLAFVWRWHGMSRPMPGRLKSAGAIAALTVLLLAYVFGVRHGQYRKLLEDARVLTPPDESWFSPPVERKRIEALQASVPPGQRILARLFVTYPFDFRRNPLFVADYTGTAGLPPGMPIGKGAEPLREYLLANRIRYVAYDPGRTSLPDDDPQTSLAAVIEHREKYGRHGWLYVQVKLTNSEQRLFGELAEKYRHLYDDGVVYVLDLERPSASAAAHDTAEEAAVR